MRIGSLLGASLLVASAVWVPAGADSPASAVSGYPSGADVKLLSPDGRAVGPFGKLRAAGKYTVFDLFADWCGPCKLIDAHLKKVTGERTDVAVRKLNVVDFDSPLARQMGEDFDALPFVVVYTPKGKRIEISGADLKAIDAALRTP